MFVHLCCIRWFGRTSHRLITAEDKTPTLCFVKGPEKGAVWFGSFMICSGLISDLRADSTSVMNSLGLSAWSRDTSACDMGLNIMTDNIQNKQ